MASPKSIFSTIMNPNDFDDTDLDGIHVQEFSSGSRGPRKRKNHNEIERRRRDVQRQKLEELRMSIPGLALDRASMITIIVKAKEYIDVLRNRVTELEMRRAMVTSVSKGGSGIPILPAPGGMVMSAPADSERLASHAKSNTPLIAQHMPPVAYHSPQKQLCPKGTLQSSKAEH